MRIIGWKLKVFFIVSSSLGRGHPEILISHKLKSLRQDLKKWQLSIARMKLLISKCNKVIVILNNLEELRPLYRQEFNFRKIVKLHVEHLLRLQYLYWKKRCTIRYIKVGEENTIFFHAIATERFRRNSIASLLQLTDGTVISDHSQVEGVI